MLDDLQDSNVFCVGTSAVREGLGEGEKHVVELRYYFKITYMNAKNSFN